GFGGDSLLVIGAVRFARRRVSRGPPAFRIAFPDLLLFLRRPRAVGHRDAVVRRSLEYHQLLGLAGDEGPRLNAGRARADESDPLASQFRILARPRGREIDLAGEVVDAGDVGAVDR